MTIRSTRVGLSLTAYRTVRLVARILARPVAGAMFILVVSAALMAVRMFLPNPIGLADNGDMVRYLCQLGLQPLNHGDPVYFDYVTHEYEAGKAASSCGTYASSELWLLEAARVVTEYVTGEPGRLDLRVMLAFHSLVSGVLIALYSMVFARFPVRRLVAAGLLWVVLADGIFADYAGSAYGEYVGILGIAIIAVSTTFFASEFGSNVVAHVLFVGGAVLCLTAKSQALTLVLPLSVFLLVMALGGLKSKGTTRWWSMLWVTVLRLAAAVVSIAVLLCAAGWTFARADPEIAAINKWEFVAVGVLGHSEHPRDELRQLGLPVGLARYAGESVWTADSIVNTPEWTTVRERLDYRSIARHLVTHPLLTAKIINGAGNDFLAARPDYLGSFAEESGAGARSKSTSLVEAVSRQLTGAGVVPLLALWGLMTWAAYRLVKRSPPRGLACRSARGAVLCVSLAVTQFLTATFGEAIENTKHMVFGIEATAFGLSMLTVAWLIAPPASLSGQPLPRWLLRGRRRADTPRRGRRSLDVGRSARPRANT